LELEREIYAADSPDVHNSAVMEKCEVRKQQGLYREALAELSRIYAYALGTDALLNYYHQRALVAYLAGEFDTSLAALDEMRASLPESTPTPTMILVEALAAGEKGDWERSQKAANHYASLLPNGDTLTAELTEIYDNTPTLRNPQVAYWLSLLPGLGQFYAGEIWSGIVSLVANGALATFGVSEMIAGNWLSGWIVGCGGLSTTFFVGQERARTLTERHNAQALRSHNDLLRKALLN
jgi:TM2 domain-containing membrane protein YozV